MALSLDVWKDTLLALIPEDLLPQINIYGLAHKRIQSKFCPSRLFDLVDRHSCSL